MRLECGFHSAWKDLSTVIARAVSIISLGTFPWGTSYTPTSLPPPPPPSPVLCLWKLPPGRVDNLVTWPKHWTAEMPQPFQPAPANWLLAPQPGTKRGLRKGERKKSVLWEPCSIPGATPTYQPGLTPLSCLQSPQKYHFIEDMMLCGENPKDTHRKLLKLVN